MGHPTTKVMSRYSKEKNIMQLDFKNVLIVSSITKFHATHHRNFSRDIGISSNSS